MEKIWDAIMGLPMSAAEMTSALKEVGGDMPGGLRWISETAYSLSDMEDLEHQRNAFGVAAIVEAGVAVAILAHSHRKIKKLEKELASVRAAVQVSSTPQAATPSEVDDRPLSDGGTVNDG